MPPLSSFTKDEIAERWARNMQACEDAIRGLREQIDDADKALIRAGIASVGSMAARIERLASERDALINEME